jgi:hypothetical protein
LLNGTSSKASELTGALWPAEYLIIYCPHTIEVMGRVRGIDALAGAHCAPIAAGVSRHPPMIAKLACKKNHFLRRTDSSAQTGYRFEAALILGNARCS